MEDDEKARAKRSSSRESRETLTALLVWLSSDGLIETMIIANMIMTSKLTNHANNKEEYQKFFARLTENFILSENFIDSLKKSECMLVVFFLQGI